MKIDFIKPDLRTLDLYRMIRSIKSGWLVAGAETLKFEQKFSGMYEKDKCIVVTSSCTSGLEIALILAKVEQGDEVITTPMSWVGSANAILTRGATPVFCDIDEFDYIPNVSEIEKLITKKTKAILIVNLYGQMADVVGLRKLSERYGIPIIEDSAHALESKRDGFRSGELTFAASFSFHAAKNITSGQGGALCIQQELGEIAKILRRDGVKNNSFGEREMQMLGGKFDLADFQSALLLGQFDRIKRNLTRRQELWENYSVFFKKLGLRFPQIRPNSEHAAHQFVVEVPSISRRDIREELGRVGIATSIHYNPIHLEPYYSKRFGYQSGSFPVAEQIGKSRISLPTYPLLRKKELNYIFKNFLNVLKLGR